MFIKSPYRASIVRVHVYASVHYVVVSWFVGLRTPAFCKWVVAAIILMNKHDIPRLQILRVYYRVRTQFLPASDLLYSICKKSNLS